MKRLLLLSISIIAYCFAFAQALVNNGATMVVESGATVNVVGSNYVNNNNGTINLNGSIKIDGDFVNNSTSGVLVNPNTNGEIVFYGLNRNISGSTNSVFEFEKLTVSNGASVNLSAGKYFTAYGNITNNGTFTLLANASGTSSLIDNGTINGMFKVQQFLTGGNGRFAHFVSNPTSNLTNVYYAQTPTTDYIYRYNEPYAANASSGWEGWYNNLETMRGYIIRYTIDQTKVFTGTPNTGTIGTDNNVTKTTSTAHQDRNGFNLVGNPYPSAIDWNATSGWTKTNLDDALYIWKPLAQIYATYIINTNTGANGGTRYIAPGQSFFVRVSSDGYGTLKMNNSVRVHNNVAFMKNEQTTTPTIHLKVENKKYSDDIAICFLNEASDLFDKGYDAYKMFSSNDSVPQLFTQIDSKNLLSINTLKMPNDFSNYSIPIGFKTGFAGNFTISLNDISGLSGEQIFLEDLVAGTTIDLKENNYSFYSTASNNITRFKLLFAIPTQVDLLKSQSIQLYSFAQTLFVNIPENTKSQIVIFDMLGKQVFTKQTSVINNVFELSKLHGDYVVKVVTSKETKTKKIFINEK